MNKRRTSERERERETARVYFIKLPKSWKEFREKFGDFLSCKSTDISGGEI